MCQTKQKRNEWRILTLLESYSILTILINSLIEILDVEFHLVN